MMRNPFSRGAALAGLVFPLAILACGGKGVTIGSNSEELRNVDPTSVNKTATACAPAAAHPNVCCSGGPDKAAECVAFVNSPFHKCDDGYTTYPDPSTCCDLNDPATCAPPPPPGGGGGSGGGGTCTYACAPGWWPVENNPGECCQLIPGQQVLECTQAFWGGGGSGGGGGVVGCGYADAGQVDPGGPILPPSTDAGPAPDAGQPGDGGLNDGDPPPPPPPPPPDCDAGPPVPPPPPPPPWPGPICNTPCPPGFQPMPNDPSVCCGPAPNGGEICFSQAVGPVPPAGPPTPQPAPAQGGTNGSTGSPPGK